jgi:cell division protein FtsI/penicillin-binding protein 2
MIPYLITFLVLLGCSRSGGENPPSPGVPRGLSDSALTRFQIECDGVMSGREGCIGVVDVKSKHLIAIVNKETFTSHVSRPGSVFKIVAAIAALAGGRVDVGYSYECKGSAEINGRRYKCWLPEGHGPVSFTEAISRSCNLYFYHLASKLDAEDLRLWAARFGFGQVSPFRLENEAPGFLTPRILEDDKLDFAVGQSEGLRVTPVQMLWLISSITAKGKFQDARLVNWNLVELVREGLKRSVQSGTSTGAFLPDFEVAGKTGTASQGIGVKTNAWFVGYAPCGDPEIALVVFVKDALGANDAAPVAGQVFRRYFALRKGHIG